MSLSWGDQANILTLLGILKCDNDSLEEESEFGQ